MLIRNFILQLAWVYLLSKFSMGSINHGNELRRLCCASYAPRIYSSCTKMHFQAVLQDNGLNEIPSQGISMDVRRALWILFIFSKVQCYSRSIMLNTRRMRVSSALRMSLSSDGWKKTDTTTISPTVMLVVQKNCQKLSLMHILQFFFSLYAWL